MRTVSSMREDAVDFTRDESADAVAEVVVSLLERESARDMALWPSLIDSGLLAVPVPERFGGDGMGLLEVSALLMELATDAAAVPALPTFGRSEEHTSELPSLMRNSYA